MSGNKTVLRKKMSDWSAVVPDACELISVSFFFFFSASSGQSCAPIYHSDTPNA